MSGNDDNDDDMELVSPISARIVDSSTSKMTGGDYERGRVQCSEFNLMLMRRMCDPVGGGKEV